MILLPRTPKLHLTACAAAAVFSVALFASSNSLNHLRAQAWEDIHWRKLPPIGTEIRKKWSSADKGYYNSIDPRLGTNCGGSEWRSPFSLIAEENLVFRTKAKLIDDLTFGLL
jgi:hypothetical protein